MTLESVECRILCPVDVILPTMQSGGCLGLDGLHAHFHLATLRRASMTEQKDSHNAVAAQ